MKHIKDLLIEKLKWKDLSKQSKVFITDKYSIENCYLQLNDFPEEPMWTLYFNDESIDFDDTPNKWVIQYSKE